MKTGFENDFTQNTDVAVDQINADQRPRTADRHELIASLNKLTDYGGTLQHPQVYALKDTQKWLNAHISYQQLPDEPYDITEKDHQETNAALQSGVFFNLATRTIDDNMRNLGTNIFPDDLPQNSMIDQADITHQNRIYFESWVTLREQAHTHSADKELIQPPVPIHDIILAKQLFRDAHKLEGTHEKQHELSQALVVALSAYSTLSSDREDPTFTTISTKSLIAYTLHDLAELGEFGDNNMAASHLAVELLWQSAEDLNRLEPGLIPQRIRESYIKEIEYLRGQYSEQLGINPNHRADTTEAIPSERIQQAIGSAALSPIRQHAA